MKVIFTVMNTTLVVVKVRPEKNSGWVPFYDEAKKDKSIWYISRF